MHVYLGLNRDVILLIVSINYRYFKDISLEIIRKLQTKKGVRQLINASLFPRKIETILHVFFATA